MQPTGQLVATQLPDGGLTSKQITSMLAARRGTIFTTLAITVALTIVITLLLPKTYTATSDVFIDYKNNDPISGRLFSPILDESYMQTQLDMIKSQPVAEKVLDSIGLERTAEYQEAVKRHGEARAHAQMIRRINDQTQVITRRSSRVIEVDYEADSPEVARDVANAIVRAYMELNQEISTVSARSRREQYNAQLEELRREADEIQEKMTQYQQKVGIIDTAERTDVETRQLSELVTALVAVQNLRQEAIARKNATDAAVRSGTAPDQLPGVAQRINISDLKSRLSDAERRLGEINAILGPRNPKTIAVTQEVEGLKDRINRESTSAIDADRIDEGRLSAQEQGLNRQIDALRVKLLQQKQHRDTILSYQRQLDSVQRVYDSAVTKYDDILMASNIQTFNMTVLREAEAPSTHTKPLMSHNVPASIVIGLVLGLAIALVAELGRRRVRCEDDLARNLPLPLIGHIGIR